MCVSDDSPLSCGLRVHLQGNLPVIAIEAFIAPFAHEAGQDSQALGAAECLDIPVENIIGGRGGRNPAVDFDFVRIVVRWLAVLFQQTRNHLWRRAAAMTCVAGHCFAPSKQVLIDRIDHLNHAACGALHRDVIRIFFPIAEYLIAVAVRAVVAQSRREEPHRFHELIDGNSLQRLNVFEDILRHQRFFLRSSLATCRQ